MKFFTKNIFFLNKSLVILPDLAKLEFSICSNNLLFDAPFFGQILFQDPATNVMEYMVYFHHDILFIMFLIFILILKFLIKIHYFFIYNKDHSFFLTKYTSQDPSFFVMPKLTKESSDIFKKFKIRLKYQNHNTLLEIIWTIIPTIILLFIVFPSFALLYLIQPSQWGDFCIKVIGSQWYWTYEYPKSSYDYSNYVPTDNIGFEKPTSHINSIKDVKTTSRDYIVESNMIPTEDLNLGEFRLLEVDQRLVLPRGTHITFYVTSSDVLHSWSVPSLGIKIDACPGRLNEVGVFIYRTSVFYGQCSEICGILHGFMPIVIQSTDLLQWYKFNNLK